MTSDASVAWQLADAASPCLTGNERTMIFVQLGCGENHLAAERILAVVVREGFPLPAALLTTLTTWLDRYVGTREEQRLRALTARVRPHTTSALLHQEARPRRTRPPLLRKTLIRLATRLCVLRQRTGNTFTVQKALPLMRNGGPIIVVGSIACYAGIRGCTTYIATKAALRSYTRTWTRESTTAASASTL
jgi:NAD(P)-dependent dehydrogenase (short-subunit alcohol dehydrogenase family)